MALPKQNLAIPFAVSLDTKTDPFQVQPGNMLSLSNAVYDADKRLQKRNGFSALAALPEGMSPTTIATQNENLVVIGNTLQAYSRDSMQWIAKGRFQPVRLSVAALVRSSFGQTAADAAVSSSGIVCTVFRNSNTRYAYQIAESDTGATLVSEVSLPLTAEQARVFVLSNYFIITFIATVAGTPHLQYISIPTNNLTGPASPVDLSTQVSSLSAGYDGVVANGALYIAWDGSDLGGAIRTSYLDSNLNQHNTTADAGYVGDLITVTSDTTGNTPVIWISFYDDSTTDINTMAKNSALNPVLVPTLVTTGDTVTHITSTAQEGSNRIYYEVDQDYSYATIPDNMIQYNSVTQLGTVGPDTVLVRSVGLASKSFIIGNHTYMLTAYPGQFQPSYFLVDDTGFVVAKLAYSNGGGYPTTQVLSNVSIQGNVARIGYLLKDLLAPVNRTQGSTVVGIYSQTGVNLATFDLNGVNLVTAEVGGSLHIAGGFLWDYDGTQLVENNFHLWPEDIQLTQSNSTGTLSAQTYFYQVTYEWTDAAGNVHRSSPSVPYEITVTAPNDTVTLDIPTLRLTAKLNVRTCIYRWSQAQQNYYMVTSITSPTLSSPTVDSIQYVDTQPDANILGNLLLYTTGGIVENIAPPACSNLCLYKSRLVLVDSENPNLLWYSKQVIENTPVEMSDLFTIYTAPTTGAQGSTGDTTALSAMDDKLILYKKDAIYYITGNGPDNAGANNDFSAATFITAVVGCINQQSIVFIPQGLVFESDKGRWLLGRDLGTQYIGSPVEGFNNYITSSAVGIPGTNQVRMTLANGPTLMYDYFYGRWGTFSNPAALSSTLYDGMHTYLSAREQVLAETPHSYVDVATPVTISFTTGWFNLAGLQGFERAYFLYLLGEYRSPHKLQVSLAFDYNPSPSQAVLISPDNFAPVYGNNYAYGQDSPYGGPPSLEQWRIFLSKQKIQAFQVTLQEVFDPSFNTAPGPGLTLSGMNLVMGIKKTYVPLKAANSIG